MFRRVFAIILFGAWIGFDLLHGACAQSKGFVATDPPQLIPSFVFEDEKGRTLDLRDFRGRYILLNLWSTTCQPCESEIPMLNELSKKLDNGKFAVITLDEDSDGRAAARLFFKHHGIDHLSVYADSGGRAPFVLRMRGMPTTIFIDPQGVEIARLEGAADWTQDSMVSYIESRAAK